ncbi:L-Ala-D/L-amino acid epimerase isoform X2 [Phoenix dactylifera]|uniref:Dipeptide epimerase n=1 Tax=Phoenix dactylifera TaxID=42345 RepID=A0A8B8JCF9_PHODC|nr:L-Ala-D/L-amino acid epimerase isoform X2 [Phoenix dactylifera]XP_026665772.1 L-Ala-D/L-amino acid epimerase isoform X2 [Phoenix dactylifera]
MDPFRSSTLGSFAPSHPFLSTPYERLLSRFPKPFRRNSVFVFAGTSTRRSSPSVPMTFGFDTLKETFSVDVSRAEGRPLDVPLIAPFTIASSRLDAVGNVAVRVELRNGSVGWGEAPVLPSVTAEDQPAALAAAGDACGLLVRSPAMTLGALLFEVARVLPGHEFASVRAGVEMALIDAVANSIRIPLWRLFGGVSNSLTTDITIPIVSPNEAAELAAKYCKQGFSTLKLKVGKDLSSDIEVLKAIRSVHPDCSFILDANEGYTAQQAIEVLDKLHEMGVVPILFEQPVHRDDWEGLHHVSHVAKDKYGVSVAADESCRGLHDAQRIIQGNLAHVINIKLAKLGVLGALEIIDVARKAGLALMIGGMVETRLAMGFAGHQAAGLGCFSFVDLDTPLLLSEDPVIGGYEVSGAVYKFTNARGHGGFLHWDNIAW